ncbi:hypothetical protein [Zavarzinia compransoris]|uniref:Uncharacterized protein n=1 Tax=Zavarzinia compransoris TaxID=1264899 RepID=A0A317EEA1_9PROT|nr:hypothetical protein [Zavarzinia compransoris]PWR23545.1 hypothetical protein DKG75_02940 [Zavarzinia compransoris]TDP47755.1 hypothetical protein DES42_10250 [Zavarzinia compransoris]
MRAAAFIIAGLQGAIFLLMLATALFTRTDAAGDGMAQGFAVISGLVLLVSGVPALVLAVLGRALGFALFWGLLPLLFLVALLG